MKMSIPPQHPAHQTMQDGVRFEGCVSMVKVDQVWSNLTLAKANGALNANRDAVMKKAKANAIAMFGRESY